MLRRSVQAYNHPPVYVAEAEKDWLLNPIDNLSGLPRHDDMEDVIVNPAEYYFDFTQDYNIEDFQFKVVPTPGHSIGGVSFIFDKESLTRRFPTAYSNETEKQHRDIFVFQRQRRWQKNCAITSTA